MNILNGGYMKKIIVIFLVFYVCLTTSVTAEEYVYNSKGQKILLKDNFTWEYIENSNSEKFNFRESIWGMSLENVKETEFGNQKYDKDGLLVYSDIISGFTSDVVYIFIKNQLVRSKYVFKNEHSNKTDFIEDYNKIKKNLEKKYGISIYDKPIWKNDLYKSDPNEWGMAIAVGHLQYFSQWETEDTDVLLYLVGENYKMNFGIEYASKSLSSLEDQVKEENILEKL
jgi:hypothetical protein